jgi:hypothetical protein
MNLVFIMLAPKIVHILKFTSEPESPRVTAYFREAVEFAFSEYNTDSKQR